MTFRAYSLGWLLLTIGCSAPNGSQTVEGPDAAPEATGASERGTGGTRTGTGGRRSIGAGGMRPTGGAMGRGGSVPVVDGGAAPSSGGRVDAGQAEASSGGFSGPDATNSGGSVGSGGTYAADGSDGASIGGAVGTGGSATVCSSGPCCDTYFKRFMPDSKKCGQVVIDLQCAGQMQGLGCMNNRGVWFSPYVVAEVSDVYCSGTSPDCNGRRELLMIMNRSCPHDTGCHSGDSNIGPNPVCRPCL